MSDIMSEMAAKAMEGKTEVPMSQYMQQLATDTANNSMEDHKKTKSGKKHKHKKKKKSVLRSRGPAY